MTPLKMNTFTATQRQRKQEPLEIEGREVAKRKNSKLGSGSGNRCGDGSMELLHLMESYERSL